ncbi:MAG: hypothetical protein WCD86_14600 [Ktedonobacteraceae bacterium]
MQTEHGKSVFVGEVRHPKMLLETSGSIGFDLQPLRGEQLDFGIVYLTTEADKLYPAVVRMIRYAKSSSSVSITTQAYQEKLSITVEGITFAQAQQARRLCQRQEPRALTFIGDVIDHFSLPVVTQDYIGIRVRPIQHDALLGLTGILKMRETIDLISLSGKHYTATIHSASRPYLDISRSDELWTQDLSVEGITLEQAQNIQRIIQMGGPQNTTALGAISTFQTTQHGIAGIELHVRMLQRGLMRKSGGEAYLISQSGEMWPVVIQHLATLSPSRAASSIRQRNEYLLTIENIPLKQIEEAQTIIQWPSPLEIDPAIWPV